MASQRLIQAPDYNISALAPDRPSWMLWFHSEHVPRQSDSRTDLHGAVDLTTDAGRYRRQTGTGGNRFAIGFNRAGSPIPNRCRFFRTFVPAFFLLLTELNYSQETSIRANRMRRHATNRLTALCIFTASILIQSLNGTLKAATTTDKTTSLDTRVSALETQVASLSTAVAILKQQTQQHATSISALQTSLQSQVKRINEQAAITSTLTAKLETQAQSVRNLAAKLTYVNVSGTDMVIEGANLHLRNGRGSTPEANGLGNLIVGYNEDDPAKPKTRRGSHNLVIGMKHSYPTYGGLVAGQENTISGAAASVTGGTLNTAGQIFSSVSGGFQNTALGGFSSVSGGAGNLASGIGGTWVGGGSGNTASGNYSAISGGATNTASGEYSSVSGGTYNAASLDGYSLSGDSALQSSLQAQAQLISDQATITAKLNNDLQAQAQLITAQTTTTANLRHDVQTQADQIQTQAGQVQALGNKLTYVDVSGTDMIIEGANLHVRNGGGNTPGVNGLGNLIIGYNEDDPLQPKDRSGSHNLVVGMKHTYSASEGIVAGQENTISGAGSSVTGGTFNTASGLYSSVSGGSHNTAIGSWSSVSGGFTNVAGGTLAGRPGYGFASWVGGGYRNTAIGSLSSVTGGATNTASGDYSTVSGGANLNQSAQNGWTGGSYHTP